MPGRSIGPLRPTCGEVATSASRTSRRRAAPYGAGRPQSPPPNHAVAASIEWSCGPLSVDDISSRSGADSRKIKAATSATKLPEHSEHPQGNAREAPLWRPRTRASANGIKSSPPRSWRTRASTACLTTAWRRVCQASDVVSIHPPYGPCNTGVAEGGSAFSCRTLAACKSSTGPLSYSSDQTGTGDESTGSKLHSNQGIPGQRPSPPRPTARRHGARPLLAEITRLGVRRCDGSGPRPARRIGVRRNDSGSCPHSRTP